MSTSERERTLETLALRNEAGNRCCNSAAVMVNPIR